MHPLWGVSRSRDSFSLTARAMLMAPPSKLEAADGAVPLEDMLVLSMLCADVLFSAPS